MQSLGMLRVLQVVVCNTYQLMYMVKSSTAGLVSERPTSNLAMYVKLLQILGIAPNTACAEG